MFFFVAVFITRYSSIHSRKDVSFERQRGGREEIVNESCFILRRGVLFPNCTLILKMNLLYPVSAKYVVYASWCIKTAFLTSISMCFSAECSIVTMDEWVPKIFCPWEMI